jgi:hypothetical protein
MVERNITAKEFDELKQKPSTRWAELMAKLKGGKDGEVFTVTLAEEECTGPGRERARQSIYALARYYGMKVRFKSEGDKIHVQKGQGTVQ